MRRAPIAFIIAIAASLLGLSAHAAFAQTDVRRVGKWTSGSYNAEGDPVRWISFEYRGKFSAKIAEKLFWEQIQQAQASDETAEAAVTSFLRLASDRHFVLGWTNDKRGEGAFVVVKYDGNGIRVAGTYSGDYGFGQWAKFPGETNGIRLLMQVGKDGEGRGLTWGFRGP